MAQLNDTMVQGDLRVTGNIYGPLKGNADTATTAQAYDTSFTGTNSIKSALDGKKNTQSAVSDPTASGNSLTFIATISQNAQGVITPTKRTVSTMGAATSSAAGSAGLVPAPAAGAQGKFLRGDKTWATPTDSKVKATAATTDGPYYILAASSPTHTTGNTTEAVYVSGITITPSNSTIAAGFFNGNADSSNKVLIINQPEQSAVDHTSYVVGWDGNNAPLSNPSTPVRNARVWMTLRQNTGGNAESYLYCDNLRVLNIDTTCGFEPLLTTERYFTWYDVNQAGTGVTERALYGIGSLDSTQSPLCPYKFEGFGLLFSTPTKLLRYKSSYVIVNGSLGDMSTIDYTYNTMWFRGTAYAATRLAKSINDSGYAVFGQVGSSSQPIYLDSNGLPVTCNTIPAAANNGALKLQLNGGTASNIFTANQSGTSTLAFETGSTAGTFKVNSTEISIAGWSTLNSLATNENKYFHTHHLETSSFTTSSGTSVVTDFLTVTFSGRVGRSSAIVLIGAGSGYRSSAYRLSWFFTTNGSISDVKTQLFTYDDISKLPAVYFDTNSFYLGLENAGNWTANIALVIACENPGNVTYGTATRTAVTAGSATKKNFTDHAVYSETITTIVKDTVVGTDPNTLYIV